jgi:hypothetical protein
MDLLKLNSMTNKFISFSKERRDQKDDHTNNSNTTNNAISVTNNATLTLEKRDSSSTKKSIEIKNKIPDYILRKTNKPIMFKSLTNTVTYKKIPLKINSNVSGGNLTNKSDI